MSQKKISPWWAFLIGIPIVIAIIYFQPGTESQRNSKEIGFNIWNKPDSIHSILSNNGMGGLGPWRYDGSEWFSGTSYLDIGIRAGETGLTSNISYYMMGKSENTVDKITIILNLNNSDDYDRASRLMERETQRLFDQLGFEAPRMFDKIIGLEDYSENTDSYNVVLDSDKDHKIWSWVLRLYNPATN